jgi:hypothetical protein
MATTALTAAATTPLAKPIQSPAVTGRCALSSAASFASFDGRKRVGQGRSETLFDSNLHMQSCSNRIPGAYWRHSAWVRPVPTRLHTSVLISAR